MITKENILHAHERIRNHVHRTPVLSNSTINELAGSNTYFKCENFQKIGAFKIRGAMNAVLSIPSANLDNGIATHSSGNHAQAIAFAARQVNTPAYIVMPDTSPAVKVNAVKGYGAKITFCEPTQAAREAALQKIVNETGAEFVHPYNDERVITGQATAAKELIEDTDELDCIIAPVGGGGLLSGSALSAFHFSKNTKVYGAEPEGAADAILSFKSDTIETAPYVNTIADGLLTKLGDKTFPIIKKYVTDIFTVTDAEIIAAMKLVYERMKVVIEPSAAVTLAVLLKYKQQFSGKRIGIIFSGGNVDLSRISAWIGA